MSYSKRTSLVLDAIQQAHVTLDKLPDTKEVQDLRAQCLACERIAEQWAHAAPTAEEREAIMKKVLSLHVKITKVHRASIPPAKMNRED